jgi:hypothetical protein
MVFTRIQGFPWACHASASSAVNTIWPTAAPGEAGNPVAITLSLYAATFSNWFSLEKIKTMVSVHIQY